MSTAAQTHLALQFIACPVCGISQSHIRGTISGIGLNAYGGSREREGVKILLQCESGHAWIFGIGNHKGDAFAYVREPLGGEVEEAWDYTSSVGTATLVRFTGETESDNWRPSSRDAKDLSILSGALPL